MLLAVDPSPRLVATLAEPWMLPVFLGLLALLAVANVTGRRYLVAGMEAVVSARAFRELVRDEGRVLTGMPLLLAVFSIVCEALVGYLAIRSFGSAEFGYLTVLALVVLVFLVKQLALTGTNELVGGHPGVQAMRFDHSLSHQLSGLVLLPLMLFATYAQPGTARVLLAVALALIGVAYLGRIVRSVMLALRTRTPLFYIIFYLCALEFLPLAVLARLALAH